MVEVVLRYRENTELLWANSTLSIKSKSTHYTEWSLSGSGWLLDYYNKVLASRGGRSTWSTLNNSG